MVKVLEKAQELYNEGKWQESDELIFSNMSKLKEKEDFAEGLRLRGWNRYYLGIKGPEDHKGENLLISKGAFREALATTSDGKKKMSILNGLPLTLWILGEQKDAWQVSDQAVQEFPDEPSVWNTRSILCRWAKNFQESVKVCEKVYETASYRRDFRTAGHGKRNRGDALKELGQIKEAEKEYAAAIGLYKNFEKETGQSAEFHIKGAMEKLRNL